MGAQDGRYALIAVKLDERTLTAEDVAVTLTGGQLAVCLLRELSAAQVDAIRDEMMIADRFVAKPLRVEERDVETPPPIAHEQESSE